MLQRVVQPAFNGGEGLSHEKIPQEFLGQIQGVGAAEFEDEFCLSVHLKGHIEGTIDTGDGIIGVGTGLADDIIVAAGGRGRGVFDVHEAVFPSV